MALESGRQPLRALDLICRTHWAITEDALRQMMLIAGRQNDIVQWEAVRAKRLEPMANSRMTDISGGVAVMPIQGPIFRHANLMTDMSGATSIGSLAVEFNALMDNPDIKSILFEIDSPGGEAAGVNEFADMVYARRGEKPMIAYVSDLACSAAYWIASSVDKIYVAEMASLGSIGVIATMQKPLGKNDSQVEFISSQSPFKRPLYKEGGADLVQQHVDTLGQIFVEKVARNRGVEVSDVLENFGNGWVLIGQDAVDAGLADEVSTFEAVLTSMKNGSSSETKPTDSPPVVQPDEDAKATAPIEVVVSAEGVPNTDAIQTAIVEAVDQTLGRSETNMDPEVEATVENNGAVPVTDQAPVQSLAPAATSEADAARIRSLEAQLERLHGERHHSEAVAFADVAIAEHRAFPAEREAMIAAYMQAATDDFKFGGSTSRVELMKNAYGSRPQHQLTMESLAPALSEIMSRGDRSTGTQDDKRPLDAKQLEELISATPTGKSALASMRNGHNAV